MRIKLLLDVETADALTRSAVRELRPLDMQAEVLLRRALGLARRCDCQRQPGGAESGRPVGEPERRAEVAA